MKVFAQLLIPLSFLLASVNVFAESYHIQAVKADHVSESDRNTVTELLRMGFRSERATLINDGKEATFVIQSRVLKLGDSFILSAEKLNSKNQVVHSVQMKAQTLSDMDTVTSRVAAALVKEVSINKTADVTNITAEEETLNTRRYQATRQWLIGLGPGWSSGLDSKGGGMTFSLGYLWGLDPDYGVSLMYTHNGGKGDEDDSSFNDFSLGMEYFFSRTKNSPVIAGRLGYGSVTRNGCGTWFNDCDDGSDSGWNAAIQGGYKFFRTSSVNVGVMASHFIAFGRFGSDNPGLSSLQIVVYY